MTRDINGPAEFLLGKMLWEKNPNKIFLASTVCLKRNIEKFNFPGKLNGDLPRTILALITKEMMKNQWTKGLTLFPAEKIDAVDKEYLMEHFLTNEKVFRAHAGEAFMLEEQGQLLTFLNIDNHIEFCMLDLNTEIENSWNRLLKIETELGKALRYAFLPRFGFLTADPGDAGTGFEAVAYLQLAALIHSGRIDEVLEALADESFLITGLQGSPTEIIGDILVIKNNYALGVSEENIISSLRSLITKLTVEEVAERSKIKREGTAEIKDRVSRAFGILVHSYQIEAVEALNALSLVKLGLDLGWMEGIGVEELNKLFFNCRRAHLLRTINTSVSGEELAHKRAEFIHETLKNVKQLI